MASEIRGQIQTKIYIMIASFSGPQSSGKTTLLNYLQEKNCHIAFVPEVTRLVKRKYHLPINEDGTNVTQLMIVTEHLRNVYKFADYTNAILDRCALDGLVYTQWLYNEGKVDKCVLDTANTIYDQIISKYDLIFYTSPDDVVLTDDGERSVNAKFRSDIIEIFNSYIANLPNVVTLCGTVEERLKTIKKEIESRKLSYILL